MSETLTVAESISTDSEQAISKLSRKLPGRRRSNTGPWVSVTSPVTAAAPADWANDDGAMAAVRQATARPRTPGRKAKKAIVDISPLLKGPEAKGPPLAPPL